MYGLGKGPKVSEEEARRVVQTIYQELLLRDPWAPGSVGPGGKGGKPGYDTDTVALSYVNCLVDRWCDVDFVRAEVIQSAEYKDKELARARAVYGGPAQSGAGTTSPGAASGGGLLETTIGGIPLPYLAGGLVLLMLLKRR
jgi:hypothetical protein